MSEARVIVSVSDYTVRDADFDEDALREAAERIADDIGMALCELGSSCGGAVVSVELCDREARTDI